MRLILHQLGSNSHLQQLLPALSSRLPFDICIAAERDISALSEDGIPHLWILVLDESADVAFKAVAQRCALPGNALTIVIDVRYEAAQRDLYLDTGVLDYLDYAALDLDDLKRTIDIAARVQRVERKERLETENFSRLSETMQVGTWDWDLRKDILAGSARAFALFGIDPSLDRPVYDSWRDTVHPQDRERVEAELVAAIAGQTDYHSVFRIYRRNGDGAPALRWIEGVGRVKRDSQGAALSMYGLNWDVTSKHQALADLEARRNCSNCLSHQTKNTFQTYFEQSLDCLVYLVESSDGRLLYTAINQAGLDHAGLALDQVLGRSPSDVLGQEAGALIEAGMRTAIRTGVPYLFKPSLEMRGATMIFDAAYIPIRDGDGRVVGVLGSARDITAGRRMEDSLVRAQKMEALGHIASGTAHDFNNVLQSLTSAIDVIERFDSPAARGGAVKAARAAVKSGQALTSGLLAFARREVLQIRPANLNQIVEDTREMIRLTVGARIDVRFDTDPDLWPALVSEQQIELAIINLAVNARDAMPHGGELTVSTRNVDTVEPGDKLAPGSHVRLTIADTGTGMTPEVLARATEAFYTTKSAGKGTGLGLNMVSSTAASMGGTVRISSVLGQGTAVSIYLARADLQPDTPSHAADASVAGGR